MCHIIAGRSFPLKIFKRKNPFPGLACWLCYELVMRGKRERERGGDGELYGILPDLLQLWLRRCKQ